MSVKLQYVGYIMVQYWLGDMLPCLTQPIGRDMIRQFMAYDGVFSHKQKGVVKATLEIV